MIIKNKIENTRVVGSYRCFIPGIKIFTQLYMCH